MIKRHTKPNPQRNIKGGIVEREASLHAVERAAGLPGVRRADARRPQDARRRPQGPDLPEVRGSGGQMSRLRERYEKEVVPALKKEFGYTNVMAVPKIEKVVVNMGLGEATPNTKILDAAPTSSARSPARSRSSRRAKKSIAAFKVRKGMPIGAMRDAARRADVRVPRPADRRRAAARARLPRRVAEGLRRPRQLHARASATS